MDCQHIYDTLDSIITDDLSGASSLNVWYSQTSKNNHMFYIEGTYDSIVDNPFQPFSKFVDEFEIKNIQFDSTSDGCHISFIFDDDVVRTIDYFAIEDESVIKVGFDGDEGVKWKPRSDFGPYTKDTVDIIETRIL